MRPEVCKQIYLSSSCRYGKTWHDWLTSAAKSIHSWRFLWNKIFFFFSFLFIFAIFGLCAFSLFWHLLSFILYLEITSPLALLFVFFFFSLPTLFSKLFFLFFLISSYHSIELRLIVNTSLVFLLTKLWKHCCFFSLVFTHFVYFYVLFSFFACPGKIFRALRNFQFCANKVFFRFFFRLFIFLFFFASMSFLYNFCSFLVSTLNLHMTTLNFFRLIFSFSHQWLKPWK